MCAIMYVCATSQCVLFIYMSFVCVELIMCVLCHLMNISVMYMCAIAHVHQ